MYAILDIESTGGKYNEEGIMEIAIYRFDGHDVVDKFVGLVNPEKEIQPFVVKLTGINANMLKRAPKFHEVAKRVIEITEGAILVAHNAQFDYRILRTEFRRLGYDFKRKTLCTVELSQKLIPNAESHSLGKLVRSLGIAVSDRHRADGDAVATLKLFKLLLIKDADKTIIKTVIRAETLGELSTRQLDMVEQLPSKTGVYYLHDKYGDIFFIGKTKDIKKRVNQHFTNVGDLARKLQKETKKVSHQETGSELIALLKEYHEIKLNKPKYNHRQSKKGFTHGIYLTQKKDNSLKFTTERANGQTNRLSSFNSLKSSNHFLSRLSEEFDLKLSELSEDKIDEVFKRYSTDRRNMVLVDKGRALGEQSVILIKNGIFKGFGYIELNHQLNNIHILETLITPIEGDLNSILIIESYLRKKNRIKILELNLAD
ncbi:exonuclease domain-containing protein [Croceitalea rosinachiae]|uniref:Exonuclease domain-containing protein n=1 Tax=Croceitalea rosinachiae TaxID=3075596 RepID=A0ABU3AAS6_9FLAO|nr:exonuclease domain-containing protein [Croceitalea sp. F388]MDT0607286.1 exonuclease domain-containing protein [Croceitalea sp. F388]